MFSTLECQFSLCFDQSPSSSNFWLCLLKTQVTHQSLILSKSECNSKLTSLLPARNTLQVIKQPYTHSSMVWLLLLLETVFVCLVIYSKESVQFMKFVPWCCLTIEYIQYKIVSFPQENVQSVQFVDVSSRPECCLRGITWNQKMLHAGNNKS